MDFDYEEFKDYGEDESEEEFDEVSDLDLWNIYSQFLLKTFNGRCRLISDKNPVCTLPTSCIT